MLNSNSNIHFLSFNYSSLTKSVNHFKITATSKMNGCAVSRLYVDSTTTTSCVTHSMLIGIETYSEVKL